MIKQGKNIFSDIELNSFCSSMKTSIKDAIEKYWEQDVNVALQAINDFRELRDEFLTKNIDFFSSQIKVESHKSVVVRLSREFIQEFMDISLDSNLKALDLNDLTPLEIKILNNFCEFLYRRLNEILIPSKGLKITEKSNKKYNLIFQIALQNGALVPIVLSVPQDRFQLNTLDKKQIFKDEDFLTSKTTVRIKVGSSKIALEELKNLAEDDIVILENSESSKLILISGELETKFNVKPDASLIFNIDNDEDENENTYEEVIMEKNLWDDIQIEVNAEFEKIKMTIGELKQITQGQIVDLGSVFDNEIFLYVENKKVAKGELMIINDRYAVRLNEIINSNNTKTATTQQPKPKEPAEKSKQQPQKPQPKPQPKPQVQVSEDEEFDYSDFEK